MNRLNQIMLYVNDQEGIADFWVKQFGFTVEGREDYGKSFAIILTDGRPNSTKLVLQNKAVVAAANPDMNLGTPSILLTTDDIEGLYLRLQENRIKVGEKVNFPNGKKVFNFADFEGNYFAIIEE
ncbi:glyoxalase [Leptospira gomenensis]|uniref:Glyoxalase n=1 Tax=Leptospira gomenensis TaxID=2484974 RepID=A0A5F1Y8H8_9LEPT|nr:VOC family protein [Leptospira gomenensis]TGK31000.1 glyoxalase [Leptospira gomenensis]TGK35623.1 glyoxalase [Leptospira gomenensis]TGK45280.1 glyoxalase [Leptospira gomenensis]TGK66194.1 glyoxalase [Leptospira gomenensis]